MRVLAVETATLAGGAALLDDERVVGEYRLDVRATHSERLLPAIERLLADAGWRAGELGGLAVSVGPGSFTGLRVGLATVKGLALGLGLPVAAVPTLDALAATLGFAALPICPVLDARKGEVYCSLYRAAGEAAELTAGAHLERLWDYLALPPEALAARLPGPALLVGDGARLVDAPHALRVPNWRSLPSPAAVGVLGSERLRRGTVTAPADLAPIYLRRSEAELSRRGPLA